MPANLDKEKGAVDFGIVVRNAEAMFGFYTGVLGLEHVADIALPRGGGMMHRIACGQTVIKLVRFDNVPIASNPPGGSAGATGLRYLTIWVTNLDELFERCAEAGVPTPVKPMQARPGVRMAFLEDPDGNWVELVQSTPV